MVIKNGKIIDLKWVIFLRFLEHASEMHKATQADDRQIKPDKTDCSGRRTLTGLSWFGSRNLNRSYELMPAGGGYFTSCNKGNFLRSTKRFDKHYAD